MNASPGAGVPVARRVGDAVGTSGLTIGDVDREGGGGRGGEARGGGMKGRESEGITPSIPIVDRVRSRHHLPLGSRA